MRNPIVHLFLVVLLGFIVYSNTFHVPFLWDDRRLIIENPFVQGRQPAEALQADEELYKHAKQRYVTMLTFALNHRLHGTTVVGYHAFNLIIHLLNAILVYLLVLLTFRTPRVRESPVAQRADHVALLSALLFVVHPIQTEAVTYIFQRLASLAAFFYLLALVLFVKARLLEQQRGDVPPAGGTGRRPSGAWVLTGYAGSLLAIVAGMFTKENTVTIPLAILLYDALFFRGGWMRRLARLAPFLLTLLIIPLHYLFGLGRTLESATREYSFIQYGRMDYFLTQLRVIVTYLRLLVFPAHQNIDYDYPLHRSPFDADVLFSFLLLLALFCLGVFLARRSRNGPAVFLFMAFGIFWFFLTLSIESSFIPLRLLICEYRLYLPSIGIFMAAAAGIVLLWGRLHRPWPRRAVLASVIALLALLAAATYQRNALWADEVRFWEDTKRESPRKFIPPYNLGCAFYDRGRYHEAIREFQFTLTLNPSYHEAYEKLGEAHFKLGNRDEAERMFREAARLKPDYARPHINLGILYDEQGRTDEALAELRTALVLDPGNARAHDDLGVVHVRRKEYAAAEREFLAALRIDPGATAVYVHLGIAYELQGRHENAVAAFRTAVRLNSGDADAHYRLGTAYARLGRSDEARAELQQALALQPGHAAAGKELAGLQQPTGAPQGGGQR